MVADPVVVAVYLTSSEEGSQVVVFGTLWRYARPLAPYLNIHPTRGVQYSVPIVDHREISLAIPRVQEQQIGTMRDCS